MPELPSLNDLPPMDRAARVQRLRDVMAEHDLDALLVSKAVNLRWLTGFTGSSGQLLVLGDQLLFVTDGRYREQAAAQLTSAGVDAEITITTTPATIYTERTSGPGRRVGLEANHITWATLRLAEAEWFPEAALVATDDLIETIRAIKDPAEVARIEAAAGIADAALAEITATAGPGTTELEIATAIEAAMMRMGADGPAFDTIVASGPNGALPHHHPSTRALESGDLMVIDMGAAVDGYCSDMTRTFAVGEIGPTQERMLDVARAAQAAGVAAVRPGVAARDVDAAARSVIAEAGWADAFVHPTGHGLGLEIHEPLRLATTSDATLAAGHVVTVEPGIYLPGIGGVRIEDTVEVTADGCRALTRSSIPATLG